MGVDLIGRPMSRNAGRFPKLTLHKASGQGVVRLDGRDVYCGPFGTVDCQTRYMKAIADWVDRGQRSATTETDPAAPSDITVNELLLGFLRWAAGHYVKDGRPTGEITNIKYAIRHAREMFGKTLAKDFGPRRLKNLRDRLIEEPTSVTKAGNKRFLCRNEVNRRTRIIVRAFKWAVAEELISPTVHQALAAVPGLAKGRSAARESEPVGPVPDATVDAVLPYVSRQVRAMMELQRYSAMRPGEACSIRTMDVDTSGQTWWFVPSSHKTEHHGIDRRIPLGPEARELLRPWLRPDQPQAFLFSAREAEVERLAAMRQAPKSPVQPSQQDRRRKRRVKKPGDAYTTDSYRQAIHYGVAKLNRRLAKEGKPPIEPFHPNQIRHLAADRINHESDPDTARVILGHRSVRTTEVSMRQDWTKAAEAMELLG
jgi:integrase